MKRGVFAVRYLACLLLVAAAVVLPREARAWQDEHPAASRAREEPQRQAVKGILAAVKEGRGDDARALLGRLVDEAGEMPVRELVDELFKVLDPNPRGPGPDDVSKGIARDAIRTILDRRPDSWGDLFFMERFQHCEALPRFLEARRVIPFAGPETRLVADGKPSPTRITRLYRVPHEASLPLRDGAIGDASIALGVTGVLPEGVVAIDHDLDWKQREAPDDDAIDGFRPLEATVRLDAPGAYVLSQEDDGFRYFQPIEVVTFRVLVRVIDAPGRPVVVMVVDAASGEGLEGVDLVLTDAAGEGREGDRRIWRLGKTDGHGVFVGPFPVDRTMLRPVIEARHGAATRSFRLDGRIDGGPPGTPGPGEEDDRLESTPAQDRAATGRGHPLALLTTDRLVYRPGDTVRYRVVLREADGGVPTAGERVRVEIRDHAGRLVHADDHRPNTFGSLAGSWTLPPDCSIGDHTVSLGGRPFTRRDPLPAPMANRFNSWRWPAGEDGVQATFTVDALAAPGFAVHIERGPEPRTARIAARDPGGAPVADARVAWQVDPTVEGDQPDGISDSWLQGYRSSFEQLAPLDDPRAWFFHAQVAEAERERAARPIPWFKPTDASRPMLCLPCGEEPIAAGSGRTDADGGMTIAWPAAEQTGQGCIADRMVRVLATVDDATGGRRAGRAVFVRDPAPPRLEIGTDRLFTLPGEPLDVRLRASRDDGQPEAGLAALLEGFLVDGPVTVDGDARPEPFLRERLRTDDRGRARMTVRVPGAGRVRFRATADRPAGEGATPPVARVDLWCAGEGIGRLGGTGGEHPLFAWDPPHLPPRSDDWGPLALDSGSVPAADIQAPSLTITPDRFAYAPGETIRLLVRGDTAPRHLFVGLETRTSLRVEAVAMKRCVDVVEIPVSAGDRGQATIWVATVQEGAIAVDARSVCLFPADRMLDVAVRPRTRQAVEAGRAAVDIEVRGPDGRARQAEVEIALIDAALSLPEERRAPHPLVALDPIQAWRGRFGDVRSFEDRSSVWMTSAAEPGTTDWLALRRFEDPGVDGDPGFERRCAIVSGDAFGTRGWGGSDTGNLLGWRGPPAALDRQAPGRGALASAAGVHVDGPPTGHLLVTDAAGKATALLDLPPPARAWRVVARAVTADGGAGEGEGMLVPSEALEVSLVAPRFLHEEDAATCYADVTSRLEQPEDVAVRVRVDGGIVCERSVRLEPGERRRVAWPLDAAATGERRVEAEASAAGEIAATTMSVPVRRLVPERRVVIEGLVGGRRRPEDSDEPGADGPYLIDTVVDLPDGAIDGETEIEVWPNAGQLPGIRGNVLETVADPPMRDETDHVGFDVGRAFDRNMISLLALRATMPAGHPAIEAIEERIARDIGVIERLQLEDGGWTEGFYSRPPLGLALDFGLLVESDAPATALLLERLLDAREAGFAVDDSTIADAGGFLATLPDDHQALALRAWAGDERARRHLATIPIGELVDRVEQHAATEADDAADPWAGGTNMLSPRERGTSPAEQLARLVRSGRADLLPSLPVPPPGEGESRSVWSARETAVVVRELARLAPEDDRLPPLMRWLEESGSDDWLVHVLEHADAALEAPDPRWLAIAAAALPPGWREARWSLEINGREVVADGSAAMKVRTDALRPGENRVVVRSGAAAGVEVAVVVRHSAVGASVTNDGWRDPDVLRTIERFVPAANGNAEGRWDPLEQGAVVSARDRLRVVLTTREPIFDLEAGLGAGLEPVLDGQEWKQPFLAAQPVHVTWSADRLVARGFCPQPHGRALVLEVRPTLPGRYRLPAAISRAVVGWCSSNFSDGGQVMHDAITEPFEIVVEE